MLKTIQIERAEEQNVRLVKELRRSNVQEELSSGVMAAAVQDVDAVKQIAQSTRYLRSLKQ